MTFIELILRSKNISRRLSNAIMRASKAGELPFTTTEEFELAGEDWSKFLTLPTLGKKTVAELQELYNEEKRIIKLEHASDSPSELDIDHYREKLNIPLPALLDGSWPVSSRLKRNLLKLGDLPYPLDSVISFIDAGRPVNLIFATGALGKDTLELIRLIERKEALAKLSAQELKRSADEKNNRTNSPQQTDVDLEILEVAWRGNCSEQLLISLFRIVNSHWPLRITASTVLNYEGTPQEFADNLGIPEQNKLEFLNLFEALTQNEISKVPMPHLLVNEFQDVKTSAIPLKYLGASLTATNLTGKELEVLRQRSSGKTLEEIAFPFSVTRERIRQIESKATKKLKISHEIALRRLGLWLEQFVEAGAGEREISNLPPELTPKTGNELVILQCAINEYAKSLTLRKGKLLNLRLHDRNDWNSEIEKVFSTLAWPINLKVITESLTHVQDAYIENYLKGRRKAEINIEGYIQSCTLSIPEMITMALRHIRRPASPDEIALEVYQLFGKRTAPHNVSARLQAMENALIVDRGIYALYEQLNYSDLELKTIRDEAARYLEQRSIYVSAKKIYEDLCPGKRAGFPPSEYELLGILQDDPRFISKRGLMIGLAEDDAAANSFLSLEDEVMRFIAEREIVTVKEVKEHLSRKRKVLDVSITQIMLKRRDIVRVKNGVYGLSSRLLKEGAPLIHLAIAVALSGRKLTGLALKSAIESIPELRSVNLNVETVEFAARQLGSHNKGGLHELRDDHVKAFLEQVSPEESDKIADGSIQPTRDTYGPYSVKDLSRADFRRFQNPQSAADLEDPNPGEIQSILRSF